MKQSEKTMKIILFCCIGLLLFATDAYAAGVQSDVLDLVRDKAADFIRNLRPLIFVLAGFGLIGFAFGAIFGKISWKWFANIAIGLFLVANVGLFVDYFASRDGTRSIYREALGYGHYLDESGSYTATSGSQTDPKTQNSASQDGANEENSSSEKVGTDCAPGTGVGCTENKNSQNELPNELKNAPEMSVDEIEKALSGSDAPKDNSEQENAADGAAESAISGTEDLGAEKVGNLYDQIAGDVINEETPDEAPLPGTGFENVYDVDGGELDGVVVTAKDYSKEKQACQLKGGTWNSDTMSCQEKAFDSGLSGITSSSQQANASVVDNASSKANTATTENTAPKTNSAVTENSSPVNNNVSDTPKVVPSAYGEQGSVVVEGQQWLYDSKSDTYYNPQSGDVKTYEDLQDEGPVFDAEMLQRMQERNECISKADQGYVWKNNQCVAPKQTAATETETAQQGTEDLKSQNQNTQSQYKEEYQNKLASYRKAYETALQQCQKTRTSCQEAIMNDASLSGNEKINKINNTCVIAQSQCQQKAIMERNQNIKKAQDEYQNKIANITQ